MARTKTPSFITEIPLKIDSLQEKEMLSRFQAGRQLFNACLGEALTRLKLLQKSEPYLKAKKLKRSDKKERSELFKEAKKLYRFSEYDNGTFSTAIANKSKWIAEKLNAHEKQTLAKRAFQAVERILLAKSKKVRFKSSTRFRSIEGKSNATSVTIRPKQVKNPHKFPKGDYRNNITCHVAEYSQVVWNKLRLNLIIDWNNPVIRHGLNSPVKYCRILWRILNGKRRWYVQLINEGLPYQKPKNYVTTGVVGLDINISNVAFVANYKAGLLPFAYKLPTYERDIKALQHKLQRSQRMHNPDNFETDFDQKIGNKIVRKKGKFIKGKKQWIKSRNYRRIAAKKAELERKKASYTKSQNRNLVNEILRHGNIIKTENVSIKAWQKRYGKAISAKSPGFFQSELARKAESAGGQFIKFSTQKTALSQTHLDGSRIKKKLSQRVHYDITGVKPMHRDLFTAFLARCVYGDKLSLWDVQCEYPDTEPYLLDAWKVHQQSAKQLAERERGNSHKSLELMSDKELSLSDTDVRVGELKT